MSAATSVGAGSGANLTLGNIVSQAGGGAHSSTRIGDLMLLRATCKTTGSVVPAAPSGWIDVGSIASGGAVNCVYARIATVDGLTAATYSFGGGAVTQLLGTTSSTFSGVFSFRSTTGGPLAVTYANGFDASSGTSYDVTLTNIGTTAVDDRIIIFTSGIGTPTFSGQTLTGSGTYGNGLFNSSTQASLLNQASTFHDCSAGGGGVLTYHLTATGATVGCSTAVCIHQLPPTLVAPVITRITPALGAIANNTAIVIDVTDGDGDLTTVLITATIGTDHVEVVYNGAIFTPAYDGSSTKSTVTNGFEYSVLRDTNWPADVTIDVRAYDIRGNSASATYVFSVASPASDDCINPAASIAPVITVESPLPYDDPAFPIDPEDFVVFTVTDADAAPGIGGGLERAVPIIMWPNGKGSLVHNGDDFTTEFLGSTRAAMTGGYRYTVRPYGGRWRQAPRLLPFAYDLTGKEAA